MTATATTVHPRTTWDGRVGRARGRGWVRRHGGRGPVGALLARRLGLPAPGRIVPARLTVWSGAAGDRWIRAFGPNRFTTTCERTPTGLVEWLGPRRVVGLDFALVAHDGGDVLRLRAVRLGRHCVGRPFWLRIEAATAAVDAGLAFAVHVSAAGRRLVGYEGWIR